jgi:HEAT repeat protein
MAGGRGLPPGGSDEARTSALMLAHSFAIGVSTVFFETAASALFLSRYGAGLVPWIYIAAAATNTATGVAYSALQERVPFRRLMLGTLCFLLAAVLAFRAGLALWDAAALGFGLLVFYRMLSALTDLEYWAVAGRLYDVRQAKRAFGLIGTGEVVARLLGSFSVPLLLAHTGVANLLLVSAAGLAAASALVALLLRRASEAPAEPRRVASGLGPAIERARHPYLALLLGLTVLGVLAKHFVDFAFLEQMRARYGGAKELAGFFGLYSGTTQALSLATRVLLSGPLLARFGIRVGLLALPLAHLACTALLVAAGLEHAPAAAVFWLVMANQGIYKVLKHPIDNPSFKVLYQPLRPGDRLAAQIAVETIVTPLGTGVAGAVVLLFGAVVPYEPARFAWLLLVLFAAWLALALRAGRAYPRALSDALGRRIADLDFDFSDQRSLEALRESLGSDRPGEVLSALTLLEGAGARDIEAPLLKLIGHEAPEVRARALERLEALRPAGAVDAALRLARDDRSSHVRAAAVRCLCASGGAGVAAEVAPYLDDADGVVRRAAFVGLLRAASDLGGSVVARALGDQVRSARPEARAWAAQVIGEAARAELAGALEVLLADASAAVRRAALSAAGRLRAPETWPLLIAALGERGFAPLAVRSLAAAGEPVIGALEAAWPDAPPAVQVGLARVAARVGGSRAASLLRRHADGGDGRVRDEALAALDALGYRADGGDHERLLARARAEAEDAAWLSAALEELEPLAEAEALRPALELQLRRGRDRVLRLLSFVYDGAALRRAREHLADPARDKRAYSLEILDVTLPRELRELVLPLCEELPAAERRRRLEGLIPQDRLEGLARLGELLAAPPERVTPWTRAAALLAVGRLGPRGAALAAGLEAAGGHAQEPIVRETAAWARERVAGRGSGANAGAGREGRAMLTVEKVVTLKSVPMFARANEEELADIAAILEELELRAGETVFRKGDMGDSLYVIVEGRVRVRDGERTIAELGEREVFGELALLDPEPRNATVEAVEDGRLLRLDREAFSELMAGNIAIVRGVLSVLCERLRRATQ